MSGAVGRIVVREAFNASVVDEHILDTASVVIA